MIKAVFFDFDGVLTLESSGSYTVAKFLEAKIGIDHDKIKNTLIRRHREILTGALDYEQELDTINHELGSTITRDLLLQAMVALTPNKAMLNVAKSLREKGVFIGIITDQSAVRIKMIRQKFILDEKFNRIIASGDVGHTKKDIEIFQLAVDGLEVASDEILFIEHTESNLEIPKLLGWQTYFHDDAKNDMNRLRDFLKSHG